jgi:hypothetical protein
VFVVLAAPAAAPASGLRQFVVGPIPVGHGYSVLAYRDGCASRPSLSNPPGSGDSGVEFIKSLPGGSEMHTYWGSPLSASCDFATGTFKLNLGRLATIDVTFHPHGRTTKATLAEGCGRASPVLQTGTTTGAVRVDIDRSFFGRVDLHRTRGSIGTAELPRCPGNIDLLAYFGSSQATPFLNAIASPAGTSWLTIESYATVTRSVESSHTIDLTGTAALFDPAFDLSSATVNGPGGPVAGQLGFSNPNHAYSGSLSGSLRVAFDVIGTKILEGSAATINSVGPMLFRCGSGAAGVCF